MITVRRAGPADGASVVEIWRAAVDATHDFLSAADRNAIDEEVQRWLPDPPLWLAVDERGTPVAFMQIVDAAMEALFVHPAHHGLGIGRALVNLALALSPGADLTTTVNEQNIQAVGFYERLGFRQTGRSELDEQGRNYPVLFLRLCAEGRSHLETPPRAEHDLALADIDVIEDRLYAHNLRMTGQDDARGLAYVIRDSDHRLLAACAGYSWAGSAELKQLWVDEHLRGRGLGRKLLAAFTDEAKRRGVGQVFVASYSFQAPEFYERAGFERVAEIADWPPGHANILLRKALLP
ncbi:acetyltransferase [Novosphingobium sp.]|uniref:acetyltransferase n=1 Tax=Novosphingobium sp. TaxID=1874826 RepID=UPI003BA8A132